MEEFKTGDLVEVSIPLNQPRVVAGKFIGLFDGDGCQMAIVNLCEPINNREIYSFPSSWVAKTEEAAL